jgi:hypothetical protein
MKPTPRPADVAPGGMSGATRMYDPSEAAHDRVRRGAMNAALLVIAALNFAQWRWLGGVRGWDWLGVVLLLIAAAPLGMAAKVFELRFKMSAEQRVRALSELPKRKKAEWCAYAALVSLALALSGPLMTWALFGGWFYDFATYYHDRPERMRHLYAVTKTLDELRAFRAPWVWTLPALAFEFAHLIRR